MAGRILLATVGTLGDLNPYIAVARELTSRGHKTIIASCPGYERNVRSAGIEFRAIPPDLSLLHNDPEVQRKSLDPNKGTEFIVRELLLPVLNESYNTLCSVASDAELIVGHFLAYAVPLVAEKLGLPWLQVYLHPTNLFSAYDPPIIPGARFLYNVRQLGVWPYRFLFNAAKLMTAQWMRPVHELRKSKGLPASNRHPLIESWSPHGTMGWFPHLLAARQPDWPEKIEITGFPFSNGSVEPSIVEPELENFVRREAPVVFTLGSTAVLQPGTFFDCGARAATELGVSALLIGPNADSCSQLMNTYKGVMAVPYAAYDQIFPFSRLVVHHGGIGSIAQSMRAGKQMIIVPFAWDQADNAERVRRLGISDVIQRQHLTAKRFSQLLDARLHNQSGISRAAELGETIRSENGLQRACNVIERAFAL